MVRIAVVEDSEQDRRALLDCLHRYEKEQKLKFSIEEFQDGEDIVTGYSADYDLLLMDIEMTFMNGMKAAEKIRELDKDVEIIISNLMSIGRYQSMKMFDYGVLFTERENEQ